MAKVWYARVLGEVLGPMEPEALKQLAMSLRVAPTDEVRQGSHGTWTNAKYVEGLFSKPGSSPLKRLTISDVVRRTAALTAPKRTAQHRGAR